MKYRKALFLSKLGHAQFLAHLDRIAKNDNRSIRSAIERAGLPLPVVKNPENPYWDLEIADDPIFVAVKKTSDPHAEQLSVFEHMALAEAAWEHYRSLPKTPMRGGGKRTS